MIARPPPRWAAGHTANGAEFAITDLLAGMGVTAYCPAFRHWVHRHPDGQRRRKPEMEDRALFPTYTFADLMSGDPGPIYEDPRFHRWLSVDGRPVLIGDDVIDSVRAIEGEVAMLPQGEPMPVFVIGEVLQFRDSALGEICGRVEAFQGGVLTVRDDKRRWRYTTADLTNVIRCAK